MRPDSPPFDHREAPFDGGLLVVTEMRPGAYMVRFHPDPRETFAMSTGVVELEEGAALFLMGLNGENFSLGQWVRARDLFFPEARWVHFERRVNGRLRYRRFPLPPLQRVATERA